MFLDFSHIGRIAPAVVDRAQVFQGQTLRLRKRFGFGELWFFDWV
jgi:hypothetical protein